MGIEFPFLNIFVLADADGVECFLFCFQFSPRCGQFCLHFRELLLLGIRFGSQKLVVGLHLTDELALV